MDIRPIEGKAPGENENTAFTIGFKMPVRPIDANALQEELQWLKQQEGRTNEDMYKDMMYRVCNLPTLSLNTLRDAIYQDAVAHGLWEGKILLCDQTDVVTNEVMELLSAVSAVTLAATKKGQEKAREHFIEELADIVIGCFSLAGRLGIDIDAAIRRKMEINKGRAWKHKGEKK